MTRPPPTPRRRRPGELPPGVAPRAVVPPPGFAQRVKAEAYARGADLAGIAALGAVETAPWFREWLAAGHAGTMDYLARGADARDDTRRPYPGTVSALVIAVDYGGREPGGPVARYARGDDYHDVLLAQLRGVHAWIEATLGHPVHGKAYVDTGPILERDLARRAGLGWFGKNTMLINPRLGSWTFLGCLLLALELEPDAPFTADHCGTCTRCLAACPTEAFVAPRVLDATRCISYLTIELRGEIDAALRGAVGGHVYGCDVCQEVCPWNVKFARELRDGSPFAPREFIAGKDAATLARDLLALDEEGFRAAFGKSPMKRAKLAGLQRNAQVVLANEAER
ncbi:MAG: tRNA epoxyqueuosine(34) reductase QueG [Gemmatimonadaceae bacterium]|jgi:epoxyqueuosine reductase|nr:tRNA epoxyqueuosine(34) reductase QueG [Gemmatimonadaceae bacterium]